MYKIMDKKIGAIKAYSLYMQCETLQEAEDAVFAAQCEEKDRDYAVYEYKIISPTGEEV